MKALPPFKLSISKENISSFSLKEILSVEPPLGSKQTQLIAYKFMLKSRQHPIPPSPQSKCSPQAVSCMSACLPPSCVCLFFHLLNHLPPPIASNHWPLPAVQSATHSMERFLNGLRTDSHGCYLLPSPLQAEVGGGEN